jgi:two-component system chemotaxis response regulator CheB
MPVRDIIVIGASAGGVEALRELAASLPPGFPASLFVVCHFPAHARSALPEILSRSGPLLAVHPPRGESFHPGQIYVAPPNQHMLLGPDGRIRLSRGARENCHRPAVDPLFRSAARYYDSRVIGVILSGSLRDGTAGLLAVRAAGGVSVVQDPKDALVAAMPESAERIAGADFVVPLTGIAPLLVRLVRDGAGPARPAAGVDAEGKLPAVVDRDMERQARGENAGRISVFTCPECGGALWQVDQPNVLRFRCHVGHVYDGPVLLTEQSEALEAALWTAVRIFREQSVLAQQLATRERIEGRLDAALRFEEQSNHAAEQGRVIHDYLLVAANSDERPGAVEDVAS